MSPITEMAHLENPQENTEPAQSVWNGTYIVKMRPARNPPVPPNLRKKGQNLKFKKICFRWRLLQCPLGIGSREIIPRLFRSFSKSQMVCWTGRI